mgnify:CR=1 FL=1
MKTNNTEAIEAGREQSLNEEFVPNTVYEGEAVMAAAAEETLAGEPAEPELALQEEHEMSTSADAAANTAGDEPPTEKPKKTRRNAKKADLDIEADADNEMPAVESAPAEDQPESVAADEPADTEAAIEADAMEEAETAVETVPAETTEADPVPDAQPASQATQGRLRRARRRTDAVTIDGGISALTDEARKRSDLIDLTESLRSKIILSGYIHGVESIGDSNVPSYAVVYHGAYKIVIPVEELVTVPDDAEQNYISAVLARRLGAEIEFIVKGIDEKAGMAAASRLDAMRIRRREFFIRKDEEGNTLLREGSEAEARIVCVLRRGIFVELFGVESFIPLVELSHLRINNATDHFSVGERVLVKILSISNIENGNIRLELSVRQANEDVILRALERYIPGNLYAGVVSMISPTGVFVAFEDVSCLCSFPPRGRPTIGAKVCVRIRGVNIEKRRLWGLIVR